MSNTKKLKTAGLNPDGTSRLAATKKKKSKSRWIIPAVIAGAALFSGIGGMSSATGSTGFFSSLKSIGSGIGKFFGFGGGAGASSASKMVSVPHGGAGLMSTGGTALKTVPALETASNSGWFSKIFSSIGNMSGSQMIGLGSILSAGGSTLSALFDDSDEVAAELLEEEKRQFDERMKYNYAALEAQSAAAEADLQMKNRVAAQSGTFMGHANPATASAEGVPSLSKGFTPKPAASFPEFHPTGGLLS